MFRYVFNNRYLIKELTKREILNRNKGSFLGIFWTLITPLAMLSVFTFVFGEIFQAKWANSEASSNMGNFTINLFIGLSIFWFFSDIISRAPTLFTSVPNYVKKVVFPLGILPMVSILSAGFNLCIYMIIIIFALVFNGISINFNIFYMLIVIGITIPMLLGLSYFLGSLGVFVRDISTLIGILLQMIMFLSPVFYPLSAIPEKVQWLFSLNPLTIVIEQSRIIMIEGKSPDFNNLLLYFFISLTILILGFKTFKLTKKGFADVL